MVASGKTLEELAEYLPQNKSELIKISGFGKVNTEKYGDQFLDIIKTYCSANGLISQINLKVPKKKGSSAATEKKGTTPKKEPTHLVSLSLYNSGNNIPAIAKTRGLAASTIESHLSLCVAEGLIDPFLFTTKEKLAVVLEEEPLIKEQGMTAAKIKLGDAFSYFDIKLAMQYLNQQKKIAIEKL
jgi:hypothetical protein